MKRKTFVCIVMLLTTLSVCAQIEITKFLGIPLDGTKPEMIQKLKSKGYHYNVTYDRLEGEFNGRDVYIHVATNNNKVYRIMVQDALYSSESNIRIRFNKLCRQFEENPKYLQPPFENYEIPETEDISYEMTIHKKCYQAAYLQVNNQLDSVTFTQKLQEFLDKKYGENLSNLSEEQQTEMLISVLMFDYSLYEDNSVWFMIDQEYGKYGILMYYDNNRNRANGEDL